MEASSVGEIFRLIPEAMREIGVIPKGRRNQQQGYQFRGIDDVYAALQPVLCKLGVFIVPTVQDERREERQTKSGGSLIYTTLRMAFRFYAPDGSYIEAVTVGEAMDSGDKSSNKAQSAAMKYACLQVFCIPTEGDNDTENDSPAPAPRRQQEQPRRELTEHDKLVIQLNEAMEAKGYDGERQNKIATAVLKKHRQPTVQMLSDAVLREFIGAVKAGTFDKTKEPAAGAA